MSMSLQNPVDSSDSICVALRPGRTSTARCRPDRRQNCANHSAAASSILSPGSPGRRLSRRGEPQRRHRAGCAKRGGRTDRGRNAAAPRAVRLPRQLGWCCGLEYFLSVLTYAAPLCFAVAQHLPRKRGRKKELRPSHSSPACGGGGAHEVRDEGGPRPI